jgi:GTP cyclohydrolase II
MHTADSSEEIRQVATAELPTPWGRFRILGFERDFREGGWPRRETAVALIMGDVRSRPPLVRIHSQCLTGEVFGSLRCDCGQQLRLALSMIAEERAGVLIYEAQEGRGIGLIPKLQAYELQDLGCDTVQANEHLGFKSDYREFILPVKILQQLGVGSLRLLTNNVDKVNAVERSGIRVVERLPCEATPNPHATPYLKAKKQKLRQLLTRL